MSKNRIGKCETKIVPWYIVLIFTYPNWDGGVKHYHWRDNSVFLISRWILNSFFFFGIFFCLFVSRVRIGSVAMRLTLTLPDNRNHNCRDPWGRRTPLHTTKVCLEPGPWQNCVSSKKQKQMPYWAFVPGCKLRSGLWTFQMYLPCNNLLFFGIIHELRHLGIH